MINTMAYLLVISILGVFKLRPKFDRIYSWLMFFVSVFLLVDFYNQTATNNLYGFSILWGKTQLGDIKLDFCPTSVTTQILLPIFFISIYALLNNNIFRSEEKRCAFNSCIILNFMALSLMFCATNYVQLITMVFVSDILGYMIIKNIEISRRYVVYNFFADMCLFMILTLVCGKIQSIDMTRLLGYEEIGRHKDFVGLTTAFSLFIKIGCFPFQRYLQDLSMARFQRMMVANMLVSPLSGLLLLLKLQNLLFVSDYYIPLYQTIMVISLIVGIMAGVIKRKLEVKITYFNVCFRSLLMLILLYNNFNWNIYLSVYFIFMYLFNQFFFEIDMCQEHRFKEEIKFNIAERKRIQLKITIIETVIALSLWGILLWKISLNVKVPNIMYTAGLLILSVCLFLNQIYLKSTQTLHFANKQQVFILSVISSIGIMAVCMYILKARLTDSISLSVLILLITIIPWYKILDKLYEKPEKVFPEYNLKLQILLQPLIYKSKSFWLFLDTFLSEKIVTASLNFISQQSAVLFLKLSKKRKIINMLCITIGVMIFIISFLKGEK